jgi:hypothetical protein
MSRKPNVNSESEKELAKVEQQFDSFQNQIEQLTLDRMNMAPKTEHEPQTKLSSNQIADAKQIYLKPEKTIGARDKFNEKFRMNWNYDKEFVLFIAENNEIKGETIEVWTRPYGGIPAEFWKVPCNIPVWGPRYLAEQLTKCKYHVFSMDRSQNTGADGTGTYYGTMVVDSVKQRLDARPVTQRRSVFLSATGS